MSDRKAERGQQWLEQLLALAGLPANVAAELKESYWLSIDETPLSEEQIATFIGSQGKVLDAMQYLVNTTVNLGQPPDEQAAYTVELNGYRVEREQQLQSMSREAAETVRQTGEEVEMPALSAAERRQVHTILKECSDLETYSRGQEPHRRLVVRSRSQTTPEPGDRSE
jgi:spoIIIJ-associated protein